MNDYLPPDRVAYRQLLEARVNKALHREREIPSKPKVERPVPKRRFLKSIKAAAVKTKIVKFRQTDFQIPASSPEREAILQRIQSGDPKGTSDLLDYDNRIEHRNALKTRTVAALTAAGFDPSQARDEEGQWAESGADGSGSASAAYTAWYNDPNKDPKKNPYGPKNNYSEDQPYGPNYDKKGKPLVGSKEWQDVHKISQEQYDETYKRVPKGDPNGDMEKYFGTEATPGSGVKAAEDRVKFLEGLSDQTDIHVLERHPIDQQATELFGPMLPEVRVDDRVIIDRKREGFLKSRIESAEADLALGDDAIKSTIRQRADEARAGLNAAVKNENARLGTATASVEQQTTELKQAKGITKEQAIATAQRGVDRTSPGISADELKGRYEDAKAVAEAGKGQRGNRENITARAEAKREWEAKDAAEAKLLHAEKYGNEYGVTKAENALAAAKKERFRAQYAVEDAKKALNAAELSEGRLNADPTGETAILHFKGDAQARVAKAQKQLDALPKQYAYASGKDERSRNFAARVDVSQDETNLDNLREGVTAPDGTVTKGRVYWNVEGVAKALSVENEIAARHSDESVVSTGSVTLWRTAEVAYVAQKYLRDHDEVVLVNDNDPGGNRAVENEGNFLKATLLNNGVENVKIVAPPNGKNGKTRTFLLPSGATELAKGADDARGAGIKLEEFEGIDRDPPPINLNTSEFRAATRPTLDKEGNPVLKRDGTVKTRVVLDEGTVPITEQALRTIALSARPAANGKTASVRLSEDTLARTLAPKEVGTPVAQSTAGRTLDRLEALGIIKREHVYDPNTPKGQRRVPGMSRARIEELVASGVMDRPRWLRKTDGGQGEDDFDLDLADSYDVRSEETTIVTVIDRRYIVPLDKTPKPIGRGERRVATAAGAAFYGLPIGSVIEADDEERAGVN